MTCIRLAWPAFPRVLAFAVFLLLSGCEKTVRWDEEVLLNTGDTILVRRTVAYSLQGGAGNPLDIKYRPERDQQMQFSWRGKTYVYRGPGGFKVLAISPEGVPVLVKNADAGAWDATTGYKCTTPFYVQFVPTANGSVWTWPSAIEPWLYNLPTNLLIDIGAPGQMQAHYSQADKLKQPFWNDPQLLFIQKVDPSYTGDLCK